MPIKRQIDLKHHIDTEGRLIKSGNGVEVPENEPLVLFRGRDRLAVQLLKIYRLMCVEDGCNDFQLEQVDEMIKRFEKFAEENPATMKQPGITRGL